ncbi:hypothetical protein KIL84_016302 [Mauremys mutica]|uniref:Uncharacterized protein n=1 Tax=Mauremys mutica TaxID=74926 RepID=A0A9D4AST3_9SAUR|nr:hypothetical protein KIL84_016302 [Mauremys mutica]
MATATPCHPTELSRSNIPPAPARYTQALRCLHPCPLTCMAQIPQLKMGTNIELGPCVLGGALSRRAVDCSYQIPRRMRGSECNYYRCVPSRQRHAPATSL